MGLEQYKQQIFQVIASACDGEADRAQCEADELLTSLRKEGYHYCRDWDDMFIGPNDPEFSACVCAEYRHFAKGE